MLTVALFLCLLDDDFYWLDLPSPEDRARTLFSDPTDYSTWETLVEATRRDPAPEQFDEFIANQISENGRDKLLR